MKKILSVLLCVTILFQVVVIKAGVSGEWGSTPTGGTTGPNGGISMTPSFRVGIVTNELRIPLKEKETFLNEKIIKQNYINCFPDIKGGIYFSPSGVWRDPKYSQWLQYSPSINELIHMPNEKTIDKVYHEIIHSAGYSSANIFFTELVNLSSNLDLASLQGKWKTLCDGSNQQYTSAKKLWYLFLQEWNSTDPRDSLENKLRVYTKYSSPQTATRQQKFENQIGYLDLLMTLYVLAENDRSVQEIYEVAIDKLLAGDDITTAPPLVTIDTVVRVKAPNYNPNRLFIPSVDYMMFVTGITQQFSMYNINAPTFDDLNSETYQLNAPSASHSRKILENLARKSIKEKPDLARNTNYRKPAYGNNAFCFGQSGVLSPTYILTDKNANIYWATSSSVESSIMETLVFNEGHVGFVIVNPDNLPTDNPRPTGALSLILEGKKNNTVEHGQSIIGEIVEGSIKLNLTTKEKDDWNKVLSNDFEAGYPKYKLKLKTTQPSHIDADVPSTYMLDFNPGYSTGDNLQYIDPERLRNLLFNEELEFKHYIQSYPIAQDQRVTFNYQVDLEVQLMNETAAPHTKKIVFTGNKGSDWISFYRPYDPMIFESEEINFAELKQGNIYNEPFEAMAGAVTTRPLYFGAGGSEFAVSSVAKFKENITATRTYRSYYSGTSCEFKDGDQAKTGFTAPSPSGASSSDTSINVHNGDLQVSATWTGTIPNKASAVSGKGNVSCPAQRDRSYYDQAKSQAQAWVSALNGWTINHVAASDGQNRTFNSWGAGIRTDSPNDPRTTNGSNFKEVPDGKDKDGNTKYKTVPDDITVQPGPDGSYTITVKASIPAHKICGPCHEHELPEVEDTWKQTVTFNKLYFDKLNVWKMDQAKINGMEELTGRDEIKAEIIQGDQNIFYNIASSDDSLGGRLRYTLEPQQHDKVVWYEGIRSNKCDGKGSNPANSSGGQEHLASYATGILYNNESYTNELDVHKTMADTKDKNSPEFAKFNERRQLLNQATLLSDFLILQTSSGDQSILYYEQAAKTKSNGEPENCQVNFPDILPTKEDMWENNDLSTYEKPADMINEGSYNGRYYDTNTKYRGSGDGAQVVTYVDNDPANKMTRPARPTKELWLAKQGIDIIDEIKNGEYISGEAEIFYRNILSHGGDSGTRTEVSQAPFNGRGLIYEAPYSDQHAKVNDVVIHNPVATEYAVVLPVSSSLDQRTPGSKLLGGNLQKDKEETIKRLKENHDKQNFIVNGNAELITETNQIINWKKIVEDKTNVVFKRREGDQWKIDGDGSFEIRVPANSNRVAKYMTLTKGSPHTAYTFKGMIGAHRCEGYFEIEALGANDTVLEKWTSSKQSNNSTVALKEVKFTSPGNTERLRISIVNGASAGSTGVDEYVFADNLELTKDGGETLDWEPLSYDITQEKEITNPDYVAAHEINNPDYVAPVNQPAQTIATGSWTAGMDSIINVYASAGGGYYQHEGEPDHEKYHVNNSYIQGKINVVAGDVLRWEGNSPKKLYKNNVEVLSSSGWWSGRRTGSSCSDAESKRNADASNTSYNSASGIYDVNGSSHSHGSVFIVPQITIPGNGEPEKLTIPDKGTPTLIIKSTSTKTLSEPPEEWYETVTIVIPAIPKVTIPGFGEVSSGDFLCLDREFQIYFPNKGNFRGDGSYGLEETTLNRGRGFVDRMDTTEWTKSKSVKFDYHVIYKGTLYPAKTKIPLEVDEELFTFYLPLANREALSAKAEFEAIAINGIALDNNTVANRRRGLNKNAKHSATRMFNIDIVGRIGNLVMEDTGDFRFSNYFKKEQVPKSWFVPNMVPRVNTAEQNNIMGSAYNIRGERVTSATQYLNTYGTLDFLEKQPDKFPLSPTNNNIEVLRKQPLRIGYPIYMDIQTIGNYYDSVEILPYYYRLDLQTNEIKQLDVYMKVDNEYKVINKHGAAVPGWDSDTIHKFSTDLDWQKQSSRRNYHDYEKIVTEYVQELTYNVDSTGQEVPINIPIGNDYVYGDAQVMNGDQRNRTFIGSSITEGHDKNPGDILPEYDYNIQAQRWHFTIKLPSSAIFVEAGMPPTQTNIDNVMNNTGVILVGLDIKVAGDTYVLQYEHQEGNTAVEITGGRYDISSVPYPVVAVMSAKYSTANDLTTRGTH